MAGWAHGPPLLSFRPASTRSPSQKGGAPPAPTASHHLRLVAAAGCGRRVRQHAGGAAGRAGAFRDRPADGASIRIRSEAGGDRHAARFGLCHSGGGTDCVVDGDTFRFAGEKYRIADIDTPETHPARCPQEAALGDAATQRLQAWLNQGAFSLESADRDTDRYGRKLRIVTRGGASVGEALIGEGLARPWEGKRRPWR